MDAYFNRDFAKAYYLFAEARELDPQDPVFSIFAARSKRYQENPPADDWAGYEKLTQK